MVKQYQLAYILGAALYVGRNCARTGYVFLIFQEQEMSMQINSSTITGTRTLVELMLNTFPYIALATTITIEDPCPVIDGAQNEYGRHSRVIFRRLSYSRGHTWTSELFISPRPPRLLRKYIFVLPRWFA